MEVRNSFQVWGEPPRSFHAANSLLETPVHFALAFEFALDSFALGELGVAFGAG